MGGNRYKWAEGYRDKGGMEIIRESLRQKSGDNGDNISAEQIRESGKQSHWKEDKDNSGSAWMVEVANSTMKRIW